MRYFELETPLYNGEPHARDWSLRFPWWIQNDLQLSDGKPIFNWNSRIFAFFHGTGERLDFPVVVGDFHVVSSPLRVALLELAPDAFEFLSFRIRSSVGDQITEGYSVAKYLLWRDAIDRKRSRLLPGETRFRKIDGNYLLDSVVLSKKRIGDAPIFRVLGCRRLHVFREDVVNKLIELKLTGLRFTPIEV